MEVKPEKVSSRSKTAPSSPGSPKAVRFAPSVKAEPRALNAAEAWSLYHFECHARQCHSCYNPLEVYIEGRRLCETGHSLAQDVAEHVCRQEGMTFSRKKDNHKLVKLEMPADYIQVAQLLKSTDRAIRSPPRTVPMVSYDRTYPVTARRTSQEAEVERHQQAKAIIEPASSRRRSTRTTAKHQSTRHSTTVFEDDIQPNAAMKEPEQKERRGSLYYEDMRRQRKEAYKVEIREPERREREGRRRERPKSEYYL